MSSPTLPGLVSDVVGNDAAWALTFQTEGTPARDVLSIGSSDYHAEIEASLPDGLDGGVYTFAIEGLTDEHHALIAQAGPEASRAATVRLFLYWRDTGSSATGLLAGLSEIFSVAPPDEALVAELSILRVSRRLGARRYETVVKAGERAQQRLATTRLDDAVEAETFGAAIQAVAATAGLAGAVDVHGLSADGTLPNAPADADKSVTIPRGPSCQMALLSLADRLQQATGRQGRGMLLVRKGRLHVGPRPIPLEGAPTPLTAAAGLIEIEAVEAAAGRRQFRLTLKGRADIRPGDVVLCELPPEEQGGPLLAIAAPAGLDAADAARLYVTSVQHRLGRTSAFVTVVVAVRIDAGSEWDAPGATDGAIGGAPPEDDAGMRDAGAAVRAARAVRGLARDVAAAAQPADVAEVRAAEQQNPAAQTLTVWRGLAPPDGRESGTRRLPVEREHPSPLSAVPYLTPFAWGGCGLVLPRYPGTRVGLVHRQGRVEDPIDIGATWEAGKAPANAQPGDWWLSLPVGVQPTRARAAIAPSEKVPEHTGPVTHDLVDAEGNRVIEVGELVVRVGRAKLGKVGERPARGTQDAVTIEHTGTGSTIVIEQNGTITLDAKGDLNLKATGTMTLTAPTVNVKTDAMDVGAR